MTLNPPADLHQSQRHAAKLMKRIVAEFRTLLDDKLRPHGVTMAQVRLLFALRSAPGSSGAELARQCQVTPQSAQALIKRAAEAGWITRSKDSVNDRIVTASLTAAGSDLLKLADRLMKGIEATLWQDVAPEEIQALIGLLEKCLKNVHPE